MKALAFHGKGRIQLDQVPDPTIEHPRDAIIKVTSCAICGSDLHIYDGMIPHMHDGDVLGHETMGEVVETGADVTNLRVGDRVVVPFTIACGECFFCKRGFYSGCERSNPNRDLAARLWQNSPSGMFGYSHMLGGYAGGQAEYLRVPFADIGPIKVPDALSDDQALFLSDIFPTGWMGAEHCDIRDGDVIAVWGCGPVGQMAIRSALLMGAGRVIAIDGVPARLTMAAEAGADCINYHKCDPVEEILSRTEGRGADGCIDCVGSEPDPFGGADALIDRVKVAAFLASDGPSVLRQAIHACRNWGHVSVVGVYGGYLDKVPMGSVVNRGITIKAGQTPVQRYMPKLLQMIEEGRLDPSFVITHKGRLEDGPDLYRAFRDKLEGCVKVVLNP